MRSSFQKNMPDSKNCHSMISAYLKKFEGKASHKVYRSEIMQFFDFYTGDIAELSEDDFVRYREHIGSSATPGTIRRKFSILNGFFRFAEKKIPGFVRPIGRTHGELKAFDTAVYAESDEFKNLISLWKNELVTDSTRKTYETHVRLFFAWAGKSPSDMVQDDFVRYRDHLRSERRKQATIWTKFIAINRFFKFRTSRNNRFKNPMNFRALNLVFPKKDRGYYSILNESEILKLLKAPDRQTLIGKRDYAILRMMLGYGLRVNEVCKLEFQDVDKERVNGKVRIWIRDRKGRIGHREDTPIILEGEPLKAFDEWMNSCGIRFERTDKVFAPFVWDLKENGLVIDYRKIESGKRRDNKTIQNMLEKYLLKAGISRDDRVLSPHALRHTCFTMLARAGVNVPDIGKLAAHQNINTTMIYIHNANSFDDHVGMKNPINSIVI